MVCRSESGRFCFWSCQCQGKALPRSSYPVLPSAKWSCLVALCLFLRETHGVWRTWEAFLRPRGRPLQFAQDVPVLAPTVSRPRHSGKVGHPIRERLIKIKVGALWERGHVKWRLSITQPDLWKSKRDRYSQCQRYSWSVFSIKTHTRNILELDRTGACTTSWTYQMPLNCSLESSPFYVMWLSCQ